MGASFQSQLDDIQRQLKDVNSQADKNQVELTSAEKALAERKAVLDKAQASVTQPGELEAAQQAYEEQSAVVAKLTSEASEIKRKKAILKEKTDTLGERSTGQAPWYLCRPKGRVQAALAPCLLVLDALYISE